MKVMTSSQASNYLKRLCAERNAVAERETRVSTYIATEKEDRDPASNPYSYEATQAMLQEFDRKILIVKHAINLFNVTTEVPDTGMTVDETLVLQQQLSEQVEKLRRMSSCPPQEKLDSGTDAPGSPAAEYRFANYDQEKVKADYEKERGRLEKIQNALDLVSTTGTLNIDI